MNFIFIEYKMNKYILYSIIGLVIIVIGVVIYMLTGSKKCPGNCNSNGTCQSDGKCKCNNSYIGDDCKQKTTCPSDCNGKGVCRGSKCDCSSGFMGDDCNTPCDSSHTGKNCKDVRCPNDCSNKGDCKDGKCDCKDGFMGSDCSTACETGYTGKDCKDHRCPDDCNNNGKCENGTCKCTDGFTGPNCIPAVECPGNGNCNGNGKCENGKCTCTGRYGGDDCSSVTCDGGGNCNNHGDCKLDGSCECEKGYGGTGCSVENKLRYNTTYKIQSNYSNAYVDTCGYYPETKNVPNAGINVTLAATKESSNGFFKLIKKDDITSTDIVYTKDNFYIKDITYDSYITLAFKGAGACQPAKDRNRYTAIILDIKSAMNDSRMSTLNLESISNPLNKEFAELDKEYIIRYSDDPRYFMETCGVNTTNVNYCKGKVTTGFYSDMTYAYKNWKFVLP